MPTVPVTGRADLTDAQWEILEPLLPRGKKPGRRRVIRGRLAGTGCIAVLTIDVPPATSKPPPALPRYPCRPVQTGERRAGRVPPAVWPGGVARVCLPSTYQ
jgi:hypothetical protein